jgi:ketosteroid isomerase-like protein
MSRENVELIRRYYALFAERGEPPWEFHAQDMEFDATAVMPDLGILRGDRAAWPALQAYVETFDDFRIELEEVVASNDEHVVTAVRDGGRLKGSAEEVHNRFFHAWTIRGGEVTRWSTYLNPIDALEAVGLAE